MDRANSDRGQQEGPETAYAKHRHQHPSPAVPASEAHRTRKGSGSSGPTGNALKNDHIDSQPKPASIEQLYAEVLRTVSPFVTTSSAGSRDQGKTMKYVIGISVFFPAILAVMVPEDVWNSLDGVDLADVFSNALIVVLIGWSIKFAVEWPWKWLREVRGAKRKIVTGAPDTNSSDLKVRIVLLRKVARYECLALVACLVIPLCTSLIMGWSRRLITVEEKRKKLVFNGLNVFLFEAWSLFRLFANLVDWQHATNHLQQLDTFEPISPSGSGSVFGQLSKIYEALLPFDVQTIKQQEIIAEKIASLESKSDEHQDLMDQILIAQEEESSTIVNYLTRLERAVFDVANSARNTPKIDSGVFVKPFPLNLKSDSYEGNVSIDQKIQALGIISEVDYSNTPSPRSSVRGSPTFDAFPYSLQSPFPNVDHPQKCFEDKKSEISNESAANFSLHGIPSTSTPHFVTRDMEYAFQRDGEASTNSTAVAEQQSNSGLILAQEIRNFAAFLKERVTIGQIIFHPYMVMKLVLKEMQTQFLLKQRNNVITLQQSASLYKLVIWNVFNHYFLENFNSINQKFVRIHTALVVPLMRTAKFLMLMTIQIPMNVVRLWISIQLFLPKVIFKFCVMYPLLVLRSKIRTSKSDPAEIFRKPRMHTRNNSGIKTPHTQQHNNPYKGMKKFRLSPSSESPNVGHDYFTNGTSIKTRGALLHKLANHLDIETEAPRHPKTAVSNGGTTYFRFGSPVELRKQS